MATNIEYTFKYQWILTNNERVEGGGGEAVITAS